MKFELNKHDIYNINVMFKFDQGPPLNSDKTATPVKNDRNNKETDKEKREKHRFN